MQITAQVRNAGAFHEVTLTTAGTSRNLAIPARADGAGSSVNGGELLMLALAICYCNDVYREAARLAIAVTAVDVEATAEFESIGLAASNIRYKARVASPATIEQIERLLRETDAVAEVHNTVRQGVNVTLVPWEARQ